MAPLTPPGSGGGCSGVALPGIERPSSAASAALQSRPEAAAALSNDVLPPPQGAPLPPPLPQQGASIGRPSSAASAALRRRPVAVAALTDDVLPPPPGASLPPPLPRQGEPSVLSASGGSSSSKGRGFRSSTPDPPHPQASGTSEALLPRSSAARRWKVAAAAVAATTPSPEPLEPGSAATEKSSEPKCRDLKGRWHNAKQLRERRNAAVLKGMRWIHKLLTANRYRGLSEVADDGACLFFEIWYTSSDSTIRCAAKGIAQELLDKYEHHLLNPEQCKCGQCKGRGRKEMTGKDVFMQCMYLVRCKEEMGLDAQAMLSKADELWREWGLSDTSHLFGVNPNDLSGVGDGDFTVLIMNIMVMEFNQILFKRRWPISWGLREVFLHLRTRTYIGPPYDPACKFHDAFYFVTHIAFAISAYSAIRMSPKDVPWLFNYNRKSALYWTKQAWTRLSGKQADRLVDIDGLAEAVDVMRGCGLTDGGDQLLCSATLALLSLQRSDGSWPYWNLGDGDRLTADEPDPAKLPYYQQLHPTWVAVQSLRDRNFEYDRKGNIQWAKFMARLLKDTNLQKLEHKIVYAWPKDPSKKKGAAKRATKLSIIEELALKDDL
mmetsp:Transcript_61250/g.138171  ORF Transcript_61250/g.138171 Transcript_61250/m.138171 type:complete len:606 (-) Transcript_61250:49-1866(-)